MELGDVTITAPADGTVHLSITGYVYMRNNITAFLGIGTAPNSMNLGSTYAGFWTGSGDDQVRLSMSAQGVFDVTQGNTYTFYAIARRNKNDAQNLYFVGVRLTAVFYAT
jgi:TRAP-type mannitol/chloroaromatic compound transport system substrate-binding protein